MKHPRQLLPANIDGLQPAGCTYMGCRYISALLPMCRQDVPHRSALEAFMGRHSICTSLVQPDMLRNEVR